MHTPFNARWERRRYGALTLALICFLIWVAIPPSPAQAGDVANGLKLAETHCTRCHVVGEINPTGGIGSTPSLQGLKTLADWRERFKTFYVRHPHLAFFEVDGLRIWGSGVPPYATPVILTSGEADDIFAFVETLAVPAR